MDNQREHYRIRYPERDRPILQAAGTKIQVVDLSEGGASCLRNALFIAGSSVTPVQLVLRDGTKFTTTAGFVREDPDRVAVQFHPPIPFPIILAEQRRLRRLYADRTDEG
jgi:hypothetical protein